MLKSIKQWVLSSDSGFDSDLDYDSFLSFSEKMIDATTDDIYLPRADMMALHFEMTANEILAVLKQRQWCVFPVTKGEIDNIYAYVRVSDVLDEIIKQSPRPLEAILQQPEYIPHTRTMMDLADTIFFKKTDLVIVVDEFGSVDGMITKQMLIQYFVDSYFSSYAPALLPPKAEENDTFIFDARTEIDDFILFFEDRKDLVKDDIEVDMDTLAGLIFHKVARVPARGEIITLSHNLDCEILDADARRVKTVRIIFKKS